MTKTDSTLDLVDRLGSALAGTHGRPVTVDALRSLVQMEVAEWRADNPQQNDNALSKTAKTQITG